MSITAMKQALEALSEWKDEAPYAWSRMDDNAITALRQAIEQAQEPVAWAVHYNGPIPLFTKTKSEAEAWGGNNIVPLYTTPPQRTWVGLTYEDMVALQKDLYNAKGESVLPTTFAMAVEAKLKEKNT